MEPDVNIELDIEVEIDSTELELEVGDTDTAETELSSDGLEISVEADVERIGTGEYEEPEFDDAATDETVADLETDIETLEGEARED